MPNEERWVVKDVDSQYLTVRNTWSGEINHAYVYKDKEAAEFDASIRSMKGAVVVPVQVIRIVQELD